MHASNLRHCTEPIHVPYSWPFNRSTKVNCSLWALEVSLEVQFESEPPTQAGCWNWIIGQKIGESNGESNLKVFCERPAVLLPLMFGFHRLDNSLFIFLDKGHFDFTPFELWHCLYVMYQAERDEKCEGMCFCKFSIGLDNSDNSLPSLSTIFVFLRWYLSGNQVKPIDFGYYLAAGRYWLV